MFCCSVSADAVAHILCDIRSPGVPSVEIGENFLLEVGSEESKKSRHVGSGSRVGSLLLTFFRWLATHFSNRHQNIC